MSLMRALLVVVAAAGLSQPVEAEVRRLILAAGANNGGVDRELLRYAVSDAEQFVEVLQEMGGLDPADVLLLRDPDLAAFEQGLADLGRRVRAASRRGDRLEVLLYYSGHADEEGLLLAGDHLGYQQLLDSLKTANAAVRIAVLDACNSGKPKPPFLVDESFDMRGYAFLTSSSADEAAQESDLIEASFFTHYLISGMRGAADVTGDGRVTLHEAYQFAFDETRTRTIGTVGGTQHPAYEGQMRGTGGVVMTEVRRNAAGLSLDETLAGQVSIRNVQQRLVAELNKSPGREVELGLVPGSYTLFLETWDAEWHLAELVLAEGDFVEVYTGDFRALTPEETKLRGGSGRRITLGRQIEVATREGYTLSLGLLTNTQDEAFRGVQFAWLVNQARERTGNQIGGLGNLALREVDGWQASVVGVNWAMGPLQGGQVGLINIASQVRGWQVAQTTNVVGKIRGWQLAGVTNFVGEVKGGQVGLLNVASEVKGWQVGLVNLSSHIEGGLPIGLINYSRSGLFNLSTWRDEVGFTMFTLASGSRSFYTAFTTGFIDEAGQRYWALGVGGGVQKRWRRFFLGLDVHGYRISHDFDDYEAHFEFWPPDVGIGLRRLVQDNYLTRIKLETGVSLLSHLSLFGGVSLNQLSTSRYEKEWEDGIFTWPGFFFGLRYGR
ncbi:MAG: caspase family protein [Candidatus Latescibacteria bacterium]|nr:caspase family protein [Candidatus Latescibacterota bacterium]